MSAHLRLTTLLARSDSLHAAWRDALPSVAPEDADEMSMRDRLALDACALALEHGRGLRDLIGAGLEDSALA